MGEVITLMDLRRKKKVHQLNGGEHSIEIVGLTAKDYFSILERFPKVAALSLGGRAMLTEALQSAPGALAAWVAAACGHSGDEEAEKAALENLTVEEATSIAEASIELTFSKGFGPFFDRLQVVMAQLSPVRTGREPDTTSPSPSLPAEDSPTQNSGT
jgi:hypothetical protein